VRARTLVVVLAAAAAAASSGPPASAAHAGGQAAARKVELAIPLGGDLLVARLDLRTAEPGARLPKIRFPGPLPEGVSAAAAVARGQRAGRAVAFVVLATASGSDAAGRIGVALGAGGGSWRVLSAVPRSPVHVLFEAGGAATAAVATADTRFCRAFGGELVRFAATAACTGRADVPEGLATLLAGGTEATPPGPHPADCFGTWFPSGPALRFGFRLACPTRSEGYGVFAAGAEHTTIPENCSQTTAAGAASSAWQCFPNPPLPPGTAITGTFDLDREPERVGAVVNPANRVVVLFSLLRQEPAGCSGSVERLTPKRLGVGIDCPPGTALFAFQIGFAGGPGAPQVRSFSTGARGCELSTALGATGPSAVRCAGYYAPAGTAGFSAALVIDLVAAAPPELDATFGAQPAGRAWELLPG
jgi:hypothetical protein